jgi:hypothetical protein
MIVLGKCGHSSQQQSLHLYVFRPVDLASFLLRRCMYSIEPAMNTYESEREIAVIDE